jgi:hypothetical protein
MKIDIRAATLRHATMAGASFVQSSTDVQIPPELLHVVAVRRPRPATGDGLLYVPSHHGSWTFQTDTGAKVPMASAVPGLVQHAH